MHSRTECRKVRSPSGCRGVHSSLPAMSKAFRMPVPVITHTNRPSVTGDGEDMFCLLPMRLPPESGRFQITARLLRSMAHSSRLPVRRSVATLRKTRSSQMTGVEPLNAGSGTFHATFSVALHVVGSPFSVLTPSSDGPRHCGQLSAVRETPIATTNAAVSRRFRTGFSLYRRVPGPLSHRYNPVSASWRPPLPSHRPLSNLRVRGTRGVVDCGGPRRDRHRRRDPRHRSPARSAAFGRTRRVDHPSPGRCRGDLGGLRRVARRPPRRVPHKSNHSRPASVDSFAGVTSLDRSAVARVGHFRSGPPTTASSASLPRAS